ncbi:hypothetical protein MRX96_022923 [Rhipicephalus microplus]
MVVGIKRNAEPAQHTRHPSSPRSGKQASFIARPAVCHGIVCLILDPPPFRPLLLSSPQKRRCRQNYEVGVISIASRRTLQHPSRCPNKARERNSSKVWGA